MADDHTGGSAGNAAHPVMFGNPITGEAKAFGMNGEIGGIGQSGGDIAAFNHGN